MEAVWLNDLGNSHVGNEMRPTIKCSNWKRTENKDKVTHSHGDRGEGWRAPQVTQSQVSLGQPAQLFTLRVLCTREALPARAQVQTKG